MCRCIACKGFDCDGSDEIYMVESVLKLPVENWIELEISSIRDEKYIVL